MSNKVKKCLLQACINHGSLSLTKAKFILARICDANELSETLDIKELVQAINSEVSEFGQSLNFVKHSLLEEEFLVFSLTYESRAVKLTANYGDEDRRYFSKLIEAILNENDYCVPIFDMYRVSNGLQNNEKQLSKTRAKDLVEVWTQQGYFLEKDDKLHFGPRMIIEYESYFKMHYPEIIKECPLCLKIVFWDIKCSLCEAKVHRECIRKFLTRNSNCPTCKKTWNTRLSS